MASQSTSQLRAPSRQTARDPRSERRLSGPGTYRARRESPGTLAVANPDRILQLGAMPAAGSIGDSLDNALAESVNGLFRTALIPR